MQMCGDSVPNIFRLDCILQILFVPRYLERMLLGFLRVWKTRNGW